VGDTGVWQHGDKACRCGRESRVLLRIDGRKDDYVVTPEGAHIMRFDYVFKDAMNVKEVQIVQERIGTITVRAVRRDGYGSKDETEIRTEIRRWISPTINVQFEYVEDIDREANGKFRAVLSRLKSA
jgi:phenylacetate-CoA ligase